MFWIALLERFLRRLIVDGSVTISLPGHPDMQFGNGAEPQVHVHLADVATVRRLVLDPELALGESYVDGKLRVRDDDIQGLLTVAQMNTHRIAKAGLIAGLQKFARNQGRKIFHSNGKSRSARNVQHHYDITPAIYDLFLDQDRQYSCAYFTEPGISLEQAQVAKKAHIARKLLLRPGMRVLDIGCGWGGLALTLARGYGAQVTGITLSKEQLAIAQDRAKAAGLQDRVSFQLVDYRDLTGRFDRIVSVGMFEHVGAAHFNTYFGHLHDLLDENGVALVHTIGITAPPQATNPWIAKYIFPGGYIPALSEVASAIQTAGLRIGDIECLRLHYAMTLRQWFDRFSAKADRAANILDDRFVRMWRYYLAASEQAFRHSAQDVFQFQLCRRPDAVPITRDYLYTPPEALRQAAE